MNKIITKEGNILKPGDFYYTVALTNNSTIGKKRGDIKTNIFVESSYVSKKHFGIFFNVNNAEEFSKNIKYVFNKGDDVIGPDSKDYVVVSKNKYAGDSYITLVLLGKDGEYVRFPEYMCNK